MNECIGTFDEETDIVTWKVIKSNIGDPEPGDVLTEPWAWTGLRHRFELLTVIFFLGEIAKDYALGNDYIIQY